MPEPSTTAEPVTASPTATNAFAALGLGRAVAVFLEEAARDADASTSGKCASATYPLTNVGFHINFIID